MPQRDDSTRLAEAMLASRRRRADQLPSGILGEIGYEFLLVLFSADANGERLTGREVALRLDAKEQSASRWLKYLSSEGFVIGDGDGDLEDTLVLSPRAIDRMETLLNEAHALRAAMLDDC